MANHELIAKLFDDVVNGKDDLRAQNSDVASIREARKWMVEIFQQWRTRDDHMFDARFRDTTIRYLQDDQLEAPHPDADRSERRACQLAEFIKQSFIAPVEAVHTKEIESLKHDNVVCKSALDDLQQAEEEYRLAREANQVRAFVPLTCYYC